MVHDGKTAIPRGDRCQGLLNTVTSFIHSAFPGGGSTQKILSSVAGSMGEKEESSREGHLGKLHSGGDI